MKDMSWYIPKDAHEALALQLALEVSKEKTKIYEDIEEIKEIISSMQVNLLSVKQDCETIRGVLSILVVVAIILIIIVIFQLIKG